MRAGRKWQSPCQELLEIFVLDDPSQNSNAKPSYADPEDNCHQ